MGLSWGLPVFALFAMLCGLLAIYPYRPASPLVWLLFYLACLPLMMLGELLAGVLFENSATRRRHIRGRVFYGVLALSVWVGLWLAGVEFLKPYFATWGG